MGIGNDILWFPKFWSTSRAENNCLQKEINSLRSDLELQNQQLNCEFQEVMHTICQIVKCNSGSDNEEKAKENKVDYDLPIKSFNFSIRRLLVGWWELRLGWDSFGKL